MKGSVELREVNVGRLTEAGRSITGEHCSHSLTCSYKRREICANLKAENGGVVRDTKPNPAAQSERQTRAGVCQLAGSRCEAYSHR